jgi:hypothetical protein
VPLAPLAGRQSIDSFPWRYRDMEGMIDIGRREFPPRVRKGAENMRRLLILGVLLLLPGCKNLQGPFQPKSPQRVDDPLLTIGEQERNGRARVGLPEDSPAVGPRTGAAAPSGYGR